MIARVLFAGPLVVFFIILTERKEIQKRSADSVPPKRKERAMRSAPGSGEPERRFTGTVGRSGREAVEADQCIASLGSCGTFRKLCRGGRGRHHDLVHALCVVVGEPRLQRTDVVSPFIGAVPRPWPHSSLPPYLKTGRRVVGRGSLLIDPFSLTSGSYYRPSTHLIPHLIFPTQIWANEVRSPPSGS